jgi:hypothetical protein
LACRRLAVRQTGQLALEHVQTCLEKGRLACDDGK